MTQYSKIASVILNEIEADVRAAIQFIKYSDLDETIKTAKLECYETDILGYILELKKEYGEDKDG